MAAESSFGPGPGLSSRGAEPSGYVTLLELARGGMATVELAVRRAEHFSRLFAIKRLRDQFSQSDDARAAFLQEGRVAALLRHPNAVSVLDVGEDSRGPYLVMQYVEGTAVSELITEAKARDELLPIQICVRACLHAAQGLRAAHELVDHVGKPQGFLHRDVSPQNVLVGFDGLARVTDFGVAQAIFTDHQTFSGTLKGKLRYMAPERLRFEKIDARADLFSLGVVLYEILACEHLFPAEQETQIAQQVLHADTPDIGLIREGVPLGLVELLFELLAKDAEFRPATAAVVAERLDAILTELEFEQGKIPTDRYMLEHFSGERLERQALIHDVLDSTLANLRLEQSRSRRLRSAVRALWGRKAVRAGAAVVGLLGLVGLGYGGLASKPQQGAPAGAGSAADPARVEAAQSSPSAAEAQGATAASATAIPVDSLPLQLVEPSSSADRRARRGRRARKTAPKAKPPKPACDPPFYYDSQGRKRVRRECF